MDIMSKIKPAACIWIIVSALVFACVTPGWCQGDIRIQVKDNVVVRGAEILLGEIADIDAPAFLKEGLAVLQVGPSPKPGRMKQIQGKRIRNLIMGHDLVDDEMLIDIPKRVFIKRGSQALGEERLKEEIEGYFSGLLGNQEFKVKEFQVRGREPYPDGNLSLVIDKAGGLGKKGRFSLYLKVFVDGVKKDRVSVRGRVAVYRPVICAGRNLEKGDVLTPEDIKVKTADIFSIDEGYLETLGDVKHMALTVNMHKGELLKKKNFRLAPMMNKGDVVKLVARKNRLSIVTLGVCREDGYANRPVMVENLKSGKLVRGLVKKDATVEVLF